MYLYISMQTRIIAFILHCNFETNLTVKKRYRENQEYSSIFKKSRISRTQTAGVSLLKLEWVFVIGERTQSIQAHRDFELYFREDYIFNGYLRKSFLEELRTNKAKIRSIDKYHSMLYSIIACSTQL